jgi:hypothetical protein
LTHSINNLNRSLDIPTLAAEASVSGGDDLIDFVCAVTTTNKKGIE